MEKQSYTAVITAPVTTKEAQEAIGNVAGWWAQNVTGSSQNLNDVFTTYFGETFGTFKIVEFEPGKKIVWLTTDCYLDLLKDKKEWLGTKIVWEISTVDNSTQIRMTHVGLVPGIECYNDCEKGWDFFIKESLLNLLIGDRGLPATGIRATITSSKGAYRGTLFSKTGPAPDFPNSYIAVDVKETDVEHVVDFYSISQYDSETFDPKMIKGSHFMLLENTPLFGNITAMDDLLKR